MVETSDFEKLISHSRPLSPEASQVVQDGVVELQNPALSPVDVKDVPSAASVACEKPFFIMDWLEDINRHDLERAQQILTAPSKKGFVTSSTATSAVSPRNAPQTGFLKRSMAVGNAWNAKGLHNAKRGRWEGAALCWENALEIRTQVLGESHLDVANTCNNLGIALGKLDRIDEALEQLQRALVIRTEHYGDEHTEVAATIHNIGNVLQQSGDLESAITYFCEAKRLQELLLGPDHVQVARACIAMGHTYAQAGELLDAREAYLDALSTFERSGLSGRDEEVQTLIKDLHDIKRVMRKLNDL